ncbi:MAG TPA: extracellular solute-binding protein [Burkholderiales bacterium]|nr:extracellular solute-binding protein [Burkholderiales bacterium]
MRKTTKSTATLAAGACALFACGAVAQTTLFEYSGPDRMEKIVAAAKKEGTLTMYTTFAEKDQPTLIKPFETKYGVKVVVWRAGTDKVLQRTLTEASARKYDVDLIHFGSPEMEALSREKILQAVNSPVHRDLQPGSVPAHREWAATLLSVWVQAYNTQLVKKQDLPRTYKDLLDPKWKGKLGIEAKNQDWFASVVDVMGGGEKGLKFFRDLVAQNGISPRTGHTLLTNMVIAGEVPLALTVYNYMPEQAKKKGAPIDWFALEPAVARSNAVGVARRAPHPSAALLFYEYMLGEGQRYLVDMDYVPSNRKAPSPLKNVRILQTDPIRTLDETEKWTKIFEDVVLKGSGN